MLCLLRFDCDDQAILGGRSSCARRRQRHIRRSNRSLSDNALCRPIAGGEVLRQPSDRPLATIRCQRLGPMGLGRFLQQPHHIPSRCDQRMLHVGVIALLLPLDPVGPNAHDRGFKPRLGGAVGRSGRARHDRIVHHRVQWFARWRPGPHKLSAWPVLADWWFEHLTAPEYRSRSVRASRSP